MPASTTAPSQHSSAARLLISLVSYCHQSFERFQVILCTASWCNNGCAQLGGNCAILKIWLLAWAIDCAPASYKLCMNVTKCKLKWHFKMHVNNMKLHGKSLEISYYFDCVHWIACNVNGVKALLSSSRHFSSSFCSFQCLAMVRVNCV